MASSKKNLYLFTSTFPYGDGEVFIKREIEILSQKFHSIFILPSIVTTKNVRFNLPENCTVIDIEEIKLSFLQKITVLSKNSLGILFMLISELLFSRQKRLAFKKTKENFFQLVTLFLKAEALKKKIYMDSDVFYTYWFSHEATLLGILKRKKAIKKFITRAHGFDLYEDNGKENYLAFRKFQLKNVTSVYCVSKTGMNYLRKIYPQYHDKIEFSYLGVDNDEINPFVKDTLVIVTCSNIVPVKRLDLLISALQDISIKAQWFHFGDGYLMDTIKEMTSKLPTNIKVEIKGKVDNQDLQMFYKYTPVSLFVNTSISEGIPVSIMEAISYGIPIIATDVGGVSEIVTEETGILLKKDFKPKELTILLNEILDSKFNNVSFRSGVRNFYERNFSGQENFNMFVDQLIAANK